MGDVILTICWIWSLWANSRVAEPTRWGRFFWWFVYIGGVCLSAIDAAFDIPKAILQGDQLWTMAECFYLVLPYIAWHLWPYPRRVEVRESSS